MLARGASLQLVVTPPATRDLSIYLGWGLNVAPTNDDVEIVPYIRRGLEAHHAFVRTPVDYLGDITVKSTSRASRIVLKVQEHFLLELIECPRLILCVACDDSGLGCA